MLHNKQPQHAFLMWWFTPKWKICHRLLTFVSFQTCITFFCWTQKQILKVIYMTCMHLADAYSHCIKVYIWTVYARESNPWPWLAPHSALWATAKSVYSELNTSIACTITTSINQSINQPIKSFTSHQDILFQNILFCVNFKSNNWLHCSYYICINAQFLSQKWVSYNPCQN